VVQIADVCASEPLVYIAFNSIKAKKIERKYHKGRTYHEERKNSVVFSRHIKIERESERISFHRAVLYVVPLSLSWPMLHNSLHTQACRRPESKTLPTVTRSELIKRHNIAEPSQNFYFILFFSSPRSADSVVLFPPFVSTVIFSRFSFLFFLLDVSVLLLLPISTIL
jgi:hypothetical protein